MYWHAEKEGEDTETNPFLQILLLGKATEGDFLCICYSNISSSDIATIIINIHKFEWKGKA